MLQCTLTPVASLQRIVATSPREGALRTGDADEPRVLLRARQA